MMRRLSDIKYAIKNVCRERNLAYIGMGVGLAVGDGVGGLPYAMVH